MSSGDRHPYLPIIIMGQRFAVPREKVKAVGHVGKLQLSDQGECRIKFKDTTITVIDPARALGRPAANAALGDHIAVVETQNGLLGMLVEGREPAFSAQCVPLPEPFAGWSDKIIAGLVTVEHEVVPVLECDHLKDFRTPSHSAAKPTSIEHRVETSSSSGDSAPSSASASAAANGRVVLFPVGSQKKAPHLGLSLVQVPEVRDRIPFAWIPGAPSWVRGIALWQNLSAIALDLGELCGFGPTTPERWIVVQGFSENERYLVPVGRDVRILPAAGAQEDSALPAAAKNWMHGAYSLADTPFWLLDVDRVSSSWQGSRA